MEELWIFAHGSGSIRHIRLDDQVFNVAVIILLIVMLLLILAKEEIEILEDISSTPLSIISSNHHANGSSKQE